MWWCELQPPPCQLAAEVSATTCWQPQGGLQGLLHGIKSYRGVRPTVECQRWVFMTHSVPVAQHEIFWYVFFNSGSFFPVFFQLDLLPVVLPDSVAIMLIWLQSPGFMTVLYEPREIALLVWIILFLSPLITANVCFHNSSKLDFPWGGYQ